MMIKAISKLQGRIHKLDDEVIQRIAAGEVIQRPANVIKELLENAVDAGATSITVSVLEGGFKSITIQDNGHGILKEDLPLLCERYATSKLNKLEDLQKIQTFGFRGEALASISHISRLSVTTKTTNSAVGYRVNYLDGILVGEPSPIAANQGTSIVIQDLFYNNAIRLRAATTTPTAKAEEYRRIVQVVQKYAINLAGRCTISCRKQQDTSMDFTSAGTNNAQDVLCMLYGEKLSKTLLLLNIAGFASGHISSAYHQGKSFIFILFVNGRLVDSPRLKKSIALLYANVLLPGTHPFVYLSLNILPQDLDVNVHPTKQEVMFLHEDEIIERIIEAIRDGIYEKSCLTPHTPPTITVAPQTRLFPLSEPSLENNFQPSIPPKRVKPFSLLPDSNNVPHYAIVRNDHKVRTLDSLIYLERATSSSHNQTKYNVVVGAPPEPLENPFSAQPSSMQFSSANSPNMQLFNAKSSNIQPLQSSNIKDNIVVQELISKVNHNSSADVTQVIAKHILVGFLDERKLFLQFDTMLILADLPRLVSAWAYSWILDSISIKRQEECLEWRPFIDGCLQTYYNNQLNRRPPDDIQKQLYSKRALLANALIQINETGDILALPAISNFSWQRVSSLSWGLFFHQIFYDGQVGSDMEQLHALVTSLASTFANWIESADKSVLEHELLPSLRKLPDLIPQYPIQLRENGSLLKVVTTHELYKIFERC